MVGAEIGTQHIAALARGQNMADTQINIVRALGNAHAIGGELPMLGTGSRGVHAAIIGFQAARGF